MNIRLAQNAVAECGTDSAKTEIASITTTPFVRRQKMSKKKYRKGQHILSLDELVKQEFVYFNDKITHRGGVESWQLRFVRRHIGKNGRIYYAEKIAPDTIVCNKFGRRFTDESELKRLMEFQTGPDAVFVID